MEEDRWRTRLVWSDADADANNADADEYADSNNADDADDNYADVEEYADACVYADVYVAAAADEDANELLIGTTPCHGG